MTKPEHPANKATIKELLWRIAVALERIARTTDPDYGK